MTFASADSQKKISFASENFANAMNIATADTEKQSVLGTKRPENFA